MGMTLADLDDIAEALSPANLSPDRLAALPAPWLPCGFLTLTFPDWSHKTFRVRLEKRGLFTGRRSLSVLIGPDNSVDYESQGTVGENGFEMFHSFRTGKPAEHAAILWEMARPGGDRFDGYELQTEKRCRWCLKVLTDPESIRTELGPKCRKRMGVRL
jgi:hypothetical protein